MVRKSQKLVKVVFEQPLIWIFSFLWLEYFPFSNLNIFLFLIGIFSFFYFECFGFFWIGIFLFLFFEFFLYLNWNHFFYFFIDGGFFIIIQKDRYLLAVMERMTYKNVIYIKLNLISDHAALTDELMLLACHKRSYLICVEFSNYYLFVFKKPSLPCWLSQFCTLRKKIKINIT